MKIKALTLMRNDTENKKSRAGPFDMNGLAWLSYNLKIIFCRKNGGWMTIGHS